MKHILTLLLASLAFSLPAQTKISDLIEGTTIVAADLIPFVDVSDTTQAASGSTKKATATNVAAGLFALNNLYYGSNIIAQRNGTNPQESRLYNTYDGTNDEWGFLKWDTNVLKIGTDKTGTGTARALDIVTNGVARANISETGNVRFYGAGTTSSFLEFLTSGGNGDIRYYNNLLGVSYSLAGDSTASGGGARLAFGAQAIVSWQSTNRQDDGTADISISRIGAGILGVGTGVQGETDGEIVSRYRRYGTGSPEGVVTADVGTTYQRTDGGAGTSFYVKESGTGNTGWVAK